MNFLNTSILILFCAFALASCQNDHTTKSHVGTFILTDSIEIQTLSTSPIFGGVSDIDNSLLFADATEAGGVVIRRVDLVGKELSRFNIDLDLASSIGTNISAIGYYEGNIAFLSEKALTVFSYEGELVSNSAFPAGIIDVQNQHLAMLQDGSIVASHGKSSKNNFLVDQVDFYHHPLLTRFKQTDLGLDHTFIGVAPLESELRKGGFRHVNPLFSNGENKNLYYLLNPSPFIQELAPDGTVIKEFKVEPTHFDMEDIDGGLMPEMLSSSQFSGMVMGEGKLCLTYRTGIPDEEMSKSEGDIGKAFEMLMETDEVYLLTYKGDEKVFEDVLLPRKIYGVIGSIGDQFIFSNYSARNEKSEMDVFYIGKVM